MDYYNKFVSKYPKVNDLAAATEEEVLKDWQGLGYYSRARNLHHSAKMIVEEHSGEFPDEYNSIIKLKGVGEYTAAAIASFAFNQDYAVLDGNVFRLLSRFFGIKTPIDSTQGKKEFSKLAQSLVPKDDAATYNQAIMEFGALQCTPVNPDCSSCPLQSKCFAYEHDIIKDLPLKEKKVKVQDRFLNYLIIQSSDQLLLNKRTQEGIWKNLFDFPLIESSSSLKYLELEKNKDFISIFKETDFSLEAESDERKHLLSHRRLYCKFYHFKVDEFSTDLLSKYRAVPVSELPQYPVPKLIENYLGEETNLLSLFK